MSQQYGADTLLAVSQVEGLREVFAEARLPQRVDEAALGQLFVCAKRLLLKAPAQLFSVSLLDFLELVCQMGSGPWTRLQVLGKEQSWGNTGIQL